MSVRRKDKLNARLNLRSSYKTPGLKSKNKGRINTENRETLETQDYTQICDRERKRRVTFSSPVSYVFRNYSPANTKRSKRLKVDDAAVDGLQSFARFGSTNVTAESCSSSMQDSDSKELCISDIGDIVRCRICAHLDPENQSQLHFESFNHDLQRAEKNDIKYESIQDAAHCTVHDRSIPQTSNTSIRNTSASKSKIMTKKSNCSVIAELKECDNGKRFQHKNQCDLFLHKSIEQNIRTSDDEAGYVKIRCESTSTDAVAKEPQITKVTAVSKVLNKHQLKLKRPKSSLTEVKTQTVTSIEENANNVLTDKEESNRPDLGNFVRRQICSCEPESREISVKDGASTKDTRKIKRQESPANSAKVEKPKSSANKLKGKNTECTDEHVDGSIDDLDKIKIPELGDHVRCQICSCGFDCEAGISYPPDSVYELGRPISEEAESSEGRKLESNLCTHDFTSDSDSISEVISDKFDKIPGNGLSVSVIKKRTDNIPLTKERQGRESSSPVLKKEIVSTESPDANKVIQSKQLERQWPIINDMRNTLVSNEDILALVKLRYDDIAIEEKENMMENSALTPNSDEDEQKSFLFQRNTFSRIPHEIVLSPISTDNDYNSQQVPDNKKKQKDSFVRKNKIFRTRDSSNAEKCSARRENLSIPETESKTCIKDAEHITDTNTEDTNKKPSKRFVVKGTSILSKRARKTIGADSDHLLPRVHRTKRRRQMQRKSESGDNGIISRLFQELDSNSSAKERTEKIESEVKYTESKSLKVKEKDLPRQDISKESSLVHQENTPDDGLQSDKEFFRVDQEKSVLYDQSLALPKKITDSQEEDSIKYSREKKIGAIFESQGEGCGNFVETERHTRIKSSTCEGNVGVLSQVRDAAYQSNVLFKEHQDQRISHHDNLHKQESQLYKGILKSAEGNEKTMKENYSVYSYLNNVYEKYSTRHLYEYAKRNYTESPIFTKYDVFFSTRDEKLLHADRLLNPKIQPDSVYNLPNENLQRTSLPKESTEQRQKTGPKNVKADITANRRDPHAHNERHKDKHRDNPERVDLYYFDHGNSGYFKTTDHRPPIATEIYIEQTEWCATRFWAEIFAILHIGLAYVVCFILQLFRFFLYSIVRPLMVGLIQTGADYFLKPLLVIMFNGAIQPMLILLYNTATSVRDLCSPIAAAVGAFLQGLTQVLGALRLVNINRTTNCYPRPPVV